MYIQTYYNGDERLGFEWDEEKRAVNIAKHGLDFPRASLAFDGPVVEDIDTRKDYGEERIRALGLVENQIILVVYTVRKNRRRIISARKASRREKEKYHRQIQQGRPPA